METNKQTAKMNVQKAKIGLLEAKVDALAYEGKLAKIVRKTASCVYDAAVLGMYGAAIVGTSLPIGSGPLDNAIKNGASTGYLLAGAVAASTAIVFGSFFSHTLYSNPLEPKRNLEDEKIKYESECETIANKLAYDKKE